MTSARRAAQRLLIAAGFAVSAVIVPVSIAATNTPTDISTPSTLAGCQGQGVPLGLNAIGAPFTQNCDLVVEPPKAIGAAPSAGAIIACRGIPGCLAQWVNNPGNVNVPNVDTRPRSNGH